MEVPRCAMCARSVPKKRKERLGQAADKGATHRHQTPGHRHCTAPPGPGCDRIGEKLGTSKFFCYRHKKILHYCCPPQEDSLLLLSPQAAGHRPASPGTEGRPDSTETNNTKRGTISYYRGLPRRRGGGPSRRPLLRDPLKGPRVPLKGPRGPLKEPRDPFKGPRDPIKGPWGA